MHKQKQKWLFLGSKLAEIYCVKICRPEAIFGLSKRVVMESFKSIWRAPGRTLESNIRNIYDSKTSRQKELEMLVLSRQRDESIMIGDDVEIIIVDVRGDKVRLGITAPKSIPVHRREIYDAIQREKSQKKEQEEKEKQQQEKPQTSQPTKES